MEKKRYHKRNHLITAVKWLGTTVVLTSASFCSTATTKLASEPNAVLPKLPVPTTAAANVVVVDANNEVQVLSFLGLTFNENLALFDRGYATPKSNVLELQKGSNTAQLNNETTITNVESQSNSSPQADNNAKPKERTSGSAIALELGFNPNLDILPPPVEESELESESVLTTESELEQNQIQKIDTSSPSEAQLAINVDQEKVDQDLAAIKEAKFVHPDWERLAIVPSENKYKGRFATASAVVNNMVYLLGGYSNNTVPNPARKPNEQNITDFYSFNPITKEYAQLADMPVPVDDTVLLPYRERYLYAISGWHKDGAVNLVQVFDILKNEWFQASPILGNGVFGHAGGIVDNVMLVCDGASMKRNFAQAPSVQIEQSCLLGEIDPMNPSYIQWQEWAHPGEQGRFRMAAVSDVLSDQICFVGGATEPYDIHGKNAQGQMTKGTSEVWCYQAESRRWQLSDAPVSSFGHRSAIVYQNKIITLGGRNQQGIIDDVIVHKRLN